MAKNFDTKKLLIGTKKESTADVAESIVQHIHDKNPAEKRNISSDETTRTTIDIPKNIYKQIKYRILELDLSIKDYVLGLVKKDLET